MGRPRKPVQTDPTSLTDEAMNEMLRQQAEHDPLSPYFELGAGHYRPSPTQLTFHRSQAYYKLVLGGGRTGKTTACVVDLAWALRGIHPFKPWCGPFTALAFAVTRQQAAMVMGRKLLDACEIRPEVLGADGQPAYPEIGSKPLIPEWEIADIGTVKHGFRTTYWVKLVNGCELWFGWSDSEETWKTVQGPKVAYAYLDENAGQRKLVIEIRKRLQDSQHPGTWHGCMVWGGHGTDDNEAFEEYRTKCEEGVADHALFHLRPGETGAVSAEATARFAAALTEDERKVHITAEANAGDVVKIYRHQWSDDLVLENDRVIAPDDNLWIGYDPGVDHPMGMLACAIGREAPRLLTAVKAWKRRGGTIEDDADELATWADGRVIAGFVYDTNLKNRDRGGGPSVLIQLKEKLSERGVVVCGWYQSKKNHAPGINLVRERMTRREVRVNPSPESGCAMLVSEIKRYKGKESTKFTGEGGIVKKDDELVDDLRYIVMAGPVWTREWSCGTTRSALAESLDDDLTADPRAARAMELSRAAAALRSGRGRARVGGLARAADGSRVAVPMWMRR